MWFSEFVQESGGSIAVVVVGSPFQFRSGSRRGEGEGRGSKEGGMPPSSPAVGQAAIVTRPTFWWADLTVRVAEHRLHGSVTVMQCAPWAGRARMQTVCLQ